MSTIRLVFPHQLYADPPGMQANRPVYLVEEYLFFRQYNFHRKKLMLHRASMKMYEEYLRKKKYKVRYIETVEEIADIRRLIPVLAGKGITGIEYTDTTDNWLEKRISLAAAASGVKLTRYPSPNFLNQPEEANDFFNGKKNYFQTDFYIRQRKQRKLLLEKDGRPLGGKWTYDTANRARFPKNKPIPAPLPPPSNAYIKEALDYVGKHFPGNYGDTAGFHYPVTYTAAEKWLDDFLETRFAEFGIYEDAMVKEEGILYHAVLTPMLNIGLLDPRHIINKAVHAAARHTIPLNSLEGFIRQLVGWREFIRLVYEKAGTVQRSTNYWGFTRKIPPSFWNGTTGIHPVDTVIRRVLQTGYSHHIERLMVLGNFMLLCEFDPGEVYRWFMEMYIDSYDWVMVPNVYGMTQFADGGLMTTKPYISGSNYLLKMGNWDKGHWQEIWDGLFWRFMHVHRRFFLTNPRLGMLIRTFDKMPVAKREKHLSRANQFLSSLDA